MITAIISAVMGAISLVWAWRNRDTLRWIGRIINVIRNKDKDGNPLPPPKQPIRDWWKRRKNK